MLQTLNVHPVQVFLVGLLSGKYAGSYVGQLRQGKDEVARRVNVARFRNSRITADRKYVLSDNVYRKLILAKALANISSTTIFSLNKILNKLFPDRGRCYVQDLGDMSMKFVFEFKLLDYEVAIVEVSGVMPKPAGVSFTTTQYLI